MEYSALYIIAIIVFLIIVVIIAKSSAKKAAAKMLEEKTRDYKAEIDNKIEAHKRELNRTYMDNVNRELAEKNAQLNAENEQLKKPALETIPIVFDGSIDDYVYDEYESTFDITYKVEVANCPYSFDDFKTKMGERIDMYVRNVFQRLGILKANGNEINKFRILLNDRFVEINRELTEMINLGLENQQMKCHLLVTNIA